MPNIDQKQCISAQTTTAVLAKQTKTGLPLIITLSWYDLAPIASMPQKPLQVINKMVQIIPDSMMK
jgi:hypothetical protein